MDIIEFSGFIRDLSNMNVLSVLGAIVANPLRAGVEREDADVGKVSRGRVGWTDGGVH